MRPWLRQLWNSGGSSDETLEVNLISASWDTSDGADRLGMSGSTLAGAYFIVRGRGSTPDRYFYFQHEDPNGRLTGDDPGQWNAALSGMTGIGVGLVAGNNSDVQVAQAVEVAAATSGLYSSVTRTGSAVQISGEIDAAASSLGDPYDDRGQRVGNGLLERGPGGLLGLRYYDVATLTGGGFTITDARCSRLNPANIPSGRFRVIATMVNRSDANAAGSVRVALFAGGASDTDPTGATLLADFGELSGAPDSGVGVMNGWTRRVALASQIVEIDGDAPPRLWVAFKGNGSASFRALGSANPNVGDWATSPGIYRSDGTMSNNPALGWEASWTGGTAGTFAFVPAIRLVIQRANNAGDYGSDGSWRRLFGAWNNDLAGAPNNTLIGVMVGMSMRSPTVENLEVDYLEAGYRTPDPADLWRLGVYAGGTAIADPNNAELVWDAGITGDPGSNAYGRITASEPRPAMPADSLMWPFLRANGQQSRIAFGGAFTWAGTVNDPDIGVTEYGGVEYEVDSTGPPPTTSDNPNMSVDANVPYEATFLTAPSDFLPGNFVSIRLGLRVRGIELTPNP